MLFRIFLRQNTDCSWPAYLKFTNDSVTDHTKSNMFKKERKKRIRPIRGPLFPEASFYHLTYLPKQGEEQTVDS